MLYEGGNQKVSKSFLISQARVSIMCEYWTRILHLSWLFNVWITGTTNSANIPDVFVSSRWENLSNRFPFVNDVNSLLFNVYFFIYFFLYKGLHVCLYGIVSRLFTIIIIITTIIVLYLLRMFLILPKNKLRLICYLDIS